MHGPSRQNSLLVPAIGVAALAILIWRYPLFHIRPIAAPVSSSGPLAFDAASAALAIWRDQIPVAAKSAASLAAVADGIEADAAAAKRRFGKTAGLDATYYLVRGSGTVVSRERNYLRIAVEGSRHATVALRIGPVFGNTVRDGCGFLDVNKSPSLEDFNALSAALNSLVEREVLPELKAKARVGSSVAFAGCAEAPDSAPDGDEPVLTIVPLEATAR